jgi:predicted Ser/Thr protein kinase
MASLTHLIHTLQSGDLSNEEFLDALDKTLATDDTGYAQLLEMLGQAHTKVPLPQHVYAEVVRRIEHLALQRNAPPDETRMLADRARLSFSERASPQRAEGFAGYELDRVKGVGDTLNGRFVLEECLGVGGMGTVYKALDLRKLEASDRNPYIAIKVLNVQFRGQPKSLIALQREARKAQTLAHRNIVTVYDFDRDGPMVYLTMEYLSGKPLSRVLRAPGFTGMLCAQALPIIAGMSNALAYAHERGFVHCDFKPANVFLTDTGEVKVIDFGIARVFLPSRSFSKASARGVARHRRRRVRKRVRAGT